MKRPDPRIPEIEKRIESLLTIIEKQNDTQAAQERRMDELQRQINNRPHVQAKGDSYQPIFDRWPGQAR